MTRAVQRQLAQTKLFDLSLEQLMLASTLAGGEATKALLRAKDKLRRI